MPGAHHSRRLPLVYVENTAVRADRMLWIPSLLLLISVVVCTMLPYIFSSQAANENFTQTFSSLSIVVQTALYALARMCSFIFIPGLQAVLVTVRGFSGAVIVVCLGEALGAVGQALLVSSTIEPLFQLSSQGPIKVLASAVNSQPFVYGLLTHLSALQVFVPYATAVALPAAASVDAMPLVFGGIIAGQLYNVFMLACAKVDDLGDFMHDTFVPTVRISATILVTYWLWQEANAHAEVNTGARVKASGQQSKTRASAAKVQFDALPDTPPPTGRRGRSSTARRSAGDAASSLAGGSRSRSVGKSPAPKSPSRKAGRAKAAGAAGKRKTTTTTSRATIAHRLETNLTEHIYENIEETPRRSSRVSRGFV